MTRARFAAALVALVCLAFAGAERARFDLWTTSDEPPHLAAAREWRWGPGMVSNFEHPVLMKVLAGPFLREGRPDLEIDDTRAGRAPFPFVLAALVLATGLFARDLAGPAAGLAAAALLAVDPTFRGHGTLVQSDVLVTLFLVAAAFALERGARQPARAWLLAAGIFYGLAMASKYSAFPFLAVFAVVAAGRLATGRGPERGRERGRGREEISSNGKRGDSDRPRTRSGDSARASGAQSEPPSLPSKKILFSSSLSRVLVFLVLPALVTLSLVQFLAFAGTSDEAFRAGLSAAFQGLPQEPAALALARAFPKWIAGYGAGLLFVKGVAGPGERFNYFLGSIRGTGTPLYFPVALAIKLTTASVVAFAAALLAAGIALVRGPRRRRLLLARAALPAALGGTYLAAACASNVNIGVRHALPAVPFLLVAALAASRSVPALRPRARRILLAGVVLLAAGESAARLGREISFGNLLVGGPAGVPPILSDSNVDWGQEQGRVFERVRRGDLGTVAMASLLVDESGASRAGIAGVAMKPDAPADTVFFSRFLWDLAAAAGKNTETWPKFVWLRGWLPPLRRGLEERATSVEPFGDAYLLLRLRPPTAAPSSPPGSSP